MAKDFAAIDRAYDEAGIQGTEAGSKDVLVNKFVKAWENQTARRAVKGGTGLTMALTLAACGGSSDSAAPVVTPPVVTPPVVTPPVVNLVDLVDGGVTVISGANPIVVVPNLTAGADSLTTTIGAGGTGVLTLQFGDAEDTVALDAASDLTGYTTLAITAGTVDVSAADLSEIATITVSSGVVMTAAQFLGLTSGVVGGSTASSVTIIVSSAEEAAAVIAAAANVSGTFAVDGIAIQGAAGSGITALQAAGFTADLLDALDAIAVENALPAAIDAVVAAEIAQEAFVDVALGNESVADIAGEEPDFDDILTAIEVSLTAIELTIDAGTPIGIADFNGENAATIAAQFTAALAELGDALVDATADIDAVEPQLQVLADALISARSAESDAIVAQAAAAAAVDAAMTVANGDNLVALSFDEVTGTLSSGATVIAGLDPSGTLQFVSPLTLDAVAGTYTVGADGAEYSVSALSAVRVAAQAELSAVDATEAAMAVTDAADIALFVAVDLEAGATGALVDAYIDAVEAVNGMQAAETAFEDALAGYQAVQALQTQAETLEAALTDAVAAITQAAPDGLGIEIVEADAGTVAFNFGDDLYGFGQDDAVAGEISVTGFGAFGVDRIYTGASGEYTFVELGADQSITDSVGSANTLEIFAEQDGADVVLYVEDIASAGNGGTTADFTIVTLTSVELADLTFNAATDILSAEATALV